MVVLTQKDIESIGESVLRDCAKRFPISTRTPIDIEQFARGYLKLRIEYRKLSDSGNLLGILTRQRILLELLINGSVIVMSVPEDTILLEERLRFSGDIRRLRFTIAHECAHRILIPASDRAEWQANYLAAALLMPRAEVFRLTESGYKPFRPALFGRRFNSRDYLRIREMADKFQISTTAMILRLKELGLIVYKPVSEYYDPLDIAAQIGGVC